MPENERISSETLVNAIRIGEYYTRQAVFAYTQNEFDKSIAGAEYVLRKLTAKRINEILRMNCCISVENLKLWKNYEFQLSFLLNTDI